MTPFAIRAGKRAAVLATIALAACSNPNSGPPPTVDLANRACTPDPVLGGARAVALDADAKVTATFDGTTACWQANGRRSLYAVFALPQSTGPVLVTVTSTPLGYGLLSPRVLLLDDQAAVVRELPRDKFTFHGNSLYLGIRLHDGERYLMVASDPATVGTPISRINEATNMTGSSIMTSSGAVGFLEIHTGSETTSMFTYSHTGTVTVSAQPMPTVK